MARILLAWELGGDYGHLMRFLTLAREFAQRGHDPVFALRELTFVDTVLRDEPFTVFQAPIWAANLSGFPAAIGFAETLMRLGFVHPPLLAGLYRGWRALVSTVGPRLILFDYAPTALLATRGLRVARALIGETFSTPPRTEPMPTYRWWQPAPTGRILMSERLVLAGANKVLARFSEPPMRRLADLLDADDDIITTASPDFDQYPGRTDGRFWGQVANLDQGASPQWPLVGSKRVFVYVKPHFRDLKILLAALRTIDASIVVHIPGAAENTFREYTAANVAFSVDPVRMSDVRRECHLGVCHAGASTAQTLVTAGKPVLLLPQHLEQLMTSKRVEALGAGLTVDFEKPPPDYARLLRRLLNDPSFTAAARIVADRQINGDPSTCVARIVERCEELMARIAPD